MTKNQRYFLLGKRNIFSKCRTLITVQHLWHQQDDSHQIQKDIREGIFSPLKLYFSCILFEFFYIFKVLTFAAHLKENIRNSKTKSVFYAFSHEIENTFLLAVFSKIMVSFMYILKFNKHLSVQCFISITAWALKKAKALIV